MIPGPQLGYVDMLDQATTARLEKTKTDGKQYQKTPIRPSAAGKCSRELYHELMEFSGRTKYDIDVIPPRISRIFGLGHSIEYHLIQDIKKHLPEFEIRYAQQSLSFAKLEAKNDTKLTQWLEGSLDLVLWSDKYKCVADVKSKGDKFNQGHKSGWDDYSEKLGRMKSVQKISDNAYWVEDLEHFLDELNDAFFEMNFRQLNLYACSDFLVERGIDHAAIFQYNKNDSRLREVRFKPSKLLALETVKKMQNVITAVDESKPELAPKEHVLGSMKCAFCPFKKECWEKDDALKAFFQTLPAKQWPKDTKFMGSKGQVLEQLFTEYLEASEAESKKADREEDIVKVMLNVGVNKVRLKTGEVFETRKLKDGIVIRRSKA